MATTLRRTTPKYATRTIADGAHDTPFAWHAPTIVLAALCVMVICSMLRHERKLALDSTANLRPSLMATIREVPPTSALASDAV